MKLYHGSYLDIIEINLGKSLKGKDFGQGFYLSSDIRQAKNIAQIRSISQNSMPVVNVYEFDEQLLNGNILKIKQFDGYTRDWAEFILANRNNCTNTPIHDFDIVV